MYHDSTPCQTEYCLVNLIRSTLSTPCCAQATQGGTTDREIGPHNGTPDRRRTARPASPGTIRNNQRSSSSHRDNGPHTSQPHLTRLQEARSHQQDISLSATRLAKTATGHQPEEEIGHKGPPATGGSFAPFDTRPTRDTFITRRPGGARPSGRRAKRLAPS